MPALAEDLAAALDPCVLAERASLAPDPWQARLLRSTAPRILLNASRQSGKSTAVAALATWTALYVPRSLVLLLSPAERQSQELFRKALDVYRASGQPEPPEAESALRLELANGSRLVALPGTERTIRSYSNVRLLVVDEASRVADGLYYSIRPMLAVSGGRLVALSTPWGKRGWWHDAWRSDQPWERYEVPATECPRIPAAFLAEERRALPELIYAAEYGCRFTDLAGQVFPSDLVLGAGRDDLAPLFDAPPVDGAPDDGPEPLFGIVEG